MMTTHIWVVRRPRLSRDRSGKPLWICQGKWLWLQQHPICVPRSNILKPWTTLLLTLSCDLNAFAHSTRTPTWALTLSRLLVQNQRRSSIAPFNFFDYSEGFAALVSCVLARHTYQCALRALKQYCTRRLLSLPSFQRQNREKFAAFFYKDSAGFPLSKCILGSL